MENVDQYGESMATVLQLSWHQQILISSHTLDLILALDEFFKKVVKINPSVDLAVSFTTQLFSSSCVCKCHLPNIPLTGILLVLTPLALQKHKQRDLKKTTKHEH